MIAPKLAFTVFVRVTIHCSDYVVLRVLLGARGAIVTIPISKQVLSQ